MDQTTQAYEQLIGRFVQWAQAEADVRAAAVIGSRARRDNHPADRLPLGEFWRLWSAVARHSYCIEIEWIICKW